jgi:tetratricopeptide (TPR) repeat protein
MHAFDAMSREKPVVLFLDDLHWSDWSTAGLIEYFGKREEPGRLLVIGTLRPDDLFHKGHPLINIQHELRLRNRCDEIRVLRFNEQEVQSYIEHYGVWKDLPRAAQQLQRYTGGNPLFLNAVVDQIRVSNGAKPHEALLDPESVLDTVPQTLRDIVEDRVRRLTAAERRVIEIASAAGMTFPASMLADAAALPVGEVERVLESLAKRYQLVGRLAVTEGGVFCGTVDKYVFLHSLYQHVVYEGLPPYSRADCHRAIARWLERAHEGDEASIAGELATHYERAGDDDQASRHFETAALTALTRSAGHEALRCAGNALKHLGRLRPGIERDQRELRVRLSICAAASSISTMGDPLVEKAYREALTVCERLHDDARLIPALLGIERYHVLRGDPIDEPSLGERAAVIARTAHDPALLAGALQQLATVRFGQGRLVDAYLYARDASSAMGDRTPNARELSAIGFGPVAAAMTVQSWAAWLLGKIDDSVELARLALGRARQLGHPLTVSFVQAWLAAPLELCGVGDAEAWAERALTDANAFEFAGVGFFAEATLGWIRARHGDRAGIEMIRNSLAFQHASGVRTWIPLMNGWLAESLNRSGEFAAALAAVDDGLTMSRQTHVRFYDAELYGLRSDALKGLAETGSYEERSTTLEQCENTIMQSLALAREQSAKMLELRSALRRVHLLPNQSHQGDAYTELSRVYKTIEGGLDAPDVIEVREVLRRRK